MFVRLLFPLTLLLSVFVHGAWLLHWPSEIRAAEASTAEPQRTRVAFSQAKIPELQPEESKPKPKKIKPQKIKQEKPKPIVQQKSESRKVSEKEPLKSEAMVSAQTVDELKAGSRQVRDEDEIRRYIARLLAHIESHKHYPKAARKRAIEGSVNVVIQLTSAGEVLNVSVQGGPKILRMAARTTIEQSMPLPIPPIALNKVTDIKYRMDFSMN